MIKSIEIMVNVVKNTHKCGLLDLLCPSRCRGCGELGEVLCEYCKNDIIMDYVNRCPKCRKEIKTKCEKCKLPFLFTYMVGFRGELIGQMVQEYKFYGIRKYGEAIAEVLDRVIPKMSGEVVLVPLPTIQKHIRERGLDHTLELAKKLARKRGWKVEQMLVRNKNTVQIGADKTTRKMQAREAYKFNPECKVRSGVIYVLIDDVWTTGASMLEAEKILRSQGAEDVGCIVVVNARLVGSTGNAEGANDEIDYGEC